MQSLKNKVQLIGNVGSDPKVRKTESGRKWARFSVATSETYRNTRGEKITETQWHQLMAWGKNAEIAEEHFRKGSQLAVEGKLINRSYLDRQGNKKYVTEVLVAEMLLLSDPWEEYFTQWNQ